MARKHTDYIIVHCAATKPDMDIGAAEIDRWHRARGFLKIGYQFVIRRNGLIEPGRDVDVPGAHAKGYNHKSVGICMVGGVDNDMEPENNYTPEQFEALEVLLSLLSEIYPEAKIIGHNEVNDYKACPCFDVQKWLTSSN